MATVNSNEVGIVNVYDEREIEIAIINPELNNSSVVSKQTISVILRS